LELYRKKVAFTLVIKIYHFNLIGNVNENSGKHFVITGGGSGLGAATAEYLVQKGASVTLVDMNVEVGTQQAQALGEKAEFVQLDVTDEQAAEQFFKDVLVKHGAVHGLVNCAGIGPSAKVVGKDGVHDLGMFSKKLQINVTGTFNMLRLAAEAMSKNEVAEGDEDRGVIVNTASVAAFDGQIGQAAYSASKGAVVAMTLPIARELARHAIRIMVIAPGIMETPMQRSTTKCTRCIRSNGSVSIAFRSS
jgi:NAD(P)-dependent dehydrogenase (short-subunit alcohol dehydrogenase family)